MTENQVVEAAEAIGAQQDADGRWYFEDDEHLVDFALEIISQDRARSGALLKRKISDFLDEQ